MAKTIGTLYQRGKQGYWWLSYCIGGKRLREPLRDDDNQPITDREQAESARERVLAPLLLGNKRDRLETVAIALQVTETKVAAADMAVNRIKIGEAFDAFRESAYCPDCSATTMTDYERYWRFFAEWAREYNPKCQYLDQVTGDDVAKYAAGLIKDGLSVNTYNKRVGLLKLLFSALHRSKKLRDNPTLELRRKRVVANSRRELTVEQVHRLLSEADGDLSVLMGVGYFTGLRMGDCCCLRWSQVDLVRRIITVLPRKTARSNPDAVVKVGIGDHLYRALTQLSRDGEYVQPSMAARYLDHNERTKLCKEIQRHFAKCGLQTVREGTGGRGNDKRAVVQYGFHSLRYSYISHQAEAGTAQPLLQQLAGHSNPAMTEHYTRISDDTARRIAGQLTLETTPEGPIILPEQIRQKLTAMTAKNWRQIRDELLRVSAN